MNTCTPQRHAHPAPCSNDAPTPLLRSKTSSPLAGPQFPKSVLGCLAGTAVGSQGEGPFVVLSQFSLPTCSRSQRAVLRMATPSRTTMVFTDWCALHFAQREFSSSHRVIHRLQNTWPQPVRTVLYSYSNRLLLRVSSGPSIMLV